MGRVSILIAAAAVVAMPALFAPTPAPAQRAVEPGDLAAGKLLVARRDLRDPNFAERVVLLIHAEEGAGAMGLVINHPSPITLAQAFRKLDAAKGRTEPVFDGGPVHRTGALALLRASGKPPNDARHVTADIYLLSGPPLERSVGSLLKSGQKLDRLRFYLGYAGWSPGQLEREVEAGAWYVLRPDPSAVFEENPASVWPRMMGRLEKRIALAAPRPALTSF